MLRVHPSQQWFPIRRIMKSITLTDFAKIVKYNGAETLGKIMPLEITVDGEVRFVLGNAEDTLNLVGVHPRMKTNIKAMYRVARQSLPPVARVVIKDVMRESEAAQ
jgi:hypothetical protein